MNWNKIIFAWSAIIISGPSVAFGYEYQVGCENQKLISFKSSSSTSEDADCEAFLKGGYKRCFDSQKNPTDKDYLVISTPNDQYYKSKESPIYSRSDVTKLIKTAVKKGNDPYLILATVILENPPLATLNGYAESWGMIPLDLVAVADMFGCTTKIPEGRSSVRLFLNQGKLKEFNADPKGTKRTV